MLFDSAGREQFGSMRKKKSQKRHRDENAGHPDRYEKPRAELTAAAGSHTSSTRRVRYRVETVANFFQHSRGGTCEVGARSGITSGEFPKEKMGRPTIAGGSEEIVG